MHKQHRFARSIGTGIFLALPVASAFTVLPVHAQKPGRVTEYVSNRVRQPLDGGGYYAAPIGRVRGRLPIEIEGRKGFSQATAFMVSPCHALTSRHVAFGDLQEIVNAGRPVSDYTMTLFIGREGDGAKYEVRAVPIAWGDTPAYVEDDWAVLQVHPCVGIDDAIGWMQTGDLDRLSWKNSDQQPILMSGFPGDRSRNASVATRLKPGTVWTSSGCRARMEAVVARHDCQSAQGMSGAPLFFIDEEGVPTVVAIDAGVDLAINDHTRSVAILPNFAVTLAGYSEQKSSNLSVVLRQETARAMDWLRTTHPGAINPQRTMAHAMAKVGPSPLAPDRP